MKTLLTDIKAQLLADITSLKGAVILPDFYVFDESIGFPMIGLLDNGDDDPGLEKGGSLARLRVSVGIYQAIVSPESSMIGDGIDKGVLDLADDVRASLETVVFSGGYQAPFYRGSLKTQALEGRDFEGFVALKVVNFEYLKYVTEGT